MTPRASVLIFCTTLGCSSSQWSGDWRISDIYDYSSECIWGAEMPAELVEDCHHEPRDWYHRDLSFLGFEATKDGCSYSYAIETHLVLGTAVRKRLSGEFRVQRWLVADSSCANPLDTVQESVHEAEMWVANPDLEVALLQIDGLGAMRCGHATNVGGSESLLQFSCSTGLTDLGKSASWTDEEGWDETVVRWAETSEEEMAERFGDK